MLHHYTIINVQYGTDPLWSQQCFTCTWGSTVSIGSSEWLSFPSKPSTRVQNLSLKLQYVDMKIVWNLKCNSSNPFLHMSLTYYYISIYIVYQMQSNSVLHNAVLFPISFDSLWRFQPSFQKWPSARWSVEDHMWSKHCHVLIDSERKQKFPHT